MLTLPVDPLVRRAALEQQLALLAPVVEHLRAAARGPSPHVADGWRGAAATSAERFGDELQVILGRAEEAAEQAVRRIRLTLAELP